MVCDVALVVDSSEVVVADRCRRHDLGGVEGAGGQQERAGQLVADGLERVVGRELEPGELGVEDERVRPGAHGPARLSGGQETFTPASRR